MKSDTFVWDSFFVRQACFALLVGAAVGGFAFRHILLGAVLMLFSVLYALMVPRPGKGILIFILVVMACVTYGTASIRTKSVIEESRIVQGTIRWVEDRLENRRLTVAIDGSRWQRRYAWVYVPVTTSVTVGDRLRLTCRTIAPASLSQELVMVAAVRRIAFLCTDARSIEIFQTKSIRRLLGSVSEWYAVSLRRVVPGTDGALIESMVLNRTGLFPQELRSKFSMTGVAHIISISGVHFGVLIIALEQLLTLIGLRPRARFMAASVIMLAYLTLIQYPVAAVRAAIMGCAALFANVLGRTINGFHVLIVTAAVYAIYNPLSVAYDISYQLSFLSMASLVFVGLVLSQRGYLVSSIATSCAAMVMTAPVVAYYFNTMSLGGLIMNIAIVPLSGPVLILALLVPLVRAIPFLGELCAAALVALTRLMTATVVDAAAIPGMSVVIPSFPWVWFLVYYVVVLMIAKRILHKRFSS